MALYTLCIFAIRFFSLYMAWLSFIWNQHLIWRISWTMIVWWTLKWFEQIFSFVILDRKISARLQMLAYSALFYNYYPEVFFSPHCHKLLGSLFVTSWHAFPLSSDHSGQLFCVVSPVGTRATPLTFWSCTKWKSRHLIWSIFVRIRDSICNITPLHRGSDTWETKAFVMGNLKENFWS